MWLIPIILATWEAEIRRIEVQGPPRKYFMRPHVQHNQSKINWRYGSSYRMPALQVQSLSSNPSSTQKKKATK
jgi:hypothetical protein